MEIHMIRDPEMLDQLLSTIRDFVKNEIFLVFQLICV